MRVAKLINEVKKRYTVCIEMIYELERLRSICEVKGISFEGEKVTGSRNTNAKSDEYNEYIMFKDEYEKYKHETLIKRKELREIIYDLDNPLNIKVMCRYCLTDKSLRQVADELGYSKSRISVIYKESLVEMQEKKYEKERKWTNMDRSGQ